jgi:hypothetical protein
MLFLAGAAFAQPAPPAPKEPAPIVSQDNAEAALAAIDASLEVERDLLKSQQDSYRAAVIERDNASARLSLLLSEMDEMVLDAAAPGEDQLVAKEREISAAEARRFSAIQKCLELTGRIEEIQQRVAGLERKEGSLRDSLPKARETLSGSWRVLYMPGVNRGIFVLKQTGTILQGQYQLDGGWKGSLQGTMIDGKIYMQRIDSKLGRSSELEGYLSPDGGSIRGTWRNYNLTDGATASGSWTASRQED